MTAQRASIHAIDGGQITAAPGGRRIAAFFLDYLIIAAYIGLLTGAGVAVRAALQVPLELPRTSGAKLLGHAASFLTLTLPVTLYFALYDASHGQGTPGKRALGLRVTTTDGRRVPLGRSLLRSALKFAPWEFAHTAIWHVPGEPFVSAPAPWNMAGYVGALAGAGWYVAALFSGTRRTPYDRIAGTTVVTALGRRR